MNCKITFILLFLLLPFSMGWINAQQVTEEIKRNETFEVMPSATIEVINKYGNVHVSTWDKDSVSFEISFYISEKNENRFNKIKNNVNFKITGNSSYRMAETVFGSKFSSFFQEIQEATNLLTTANQSRIDYFIKVPSYITLKINNRYGNVFIPDFRGNLDVQLSNGDFQARNLIGSNSIDLAFGKASIQTFDRGNLKLNFVEAQINKTTQLDLDTRSSQVKIDNANLIKLKSKRDEIDIKKVSYIFGDTYFSKLTILGLSTEFNLLMQYGELVHLGILPQFKLLKLNSEYANSTIIMDKSQQPYKCNILAPKSEINLPNELIAQTAAWKEKIAEEAMLFHYKSASAKEKMQIHINDAMLKLIHK